MLVRQIRMDTFYNKDCLSSLGCIQHDFSQKQREFQQYSLHRWLVLVIVCIKLYGMWAGRWHVGGSSYKGGQ